MTKLTGPRTLDVLPERNLEDDPAYLIPEFAASDKCQELVMDYLSSKDNKIAPRLDLTARIDEAYQKLYQERIAR